MIGVPASERDQFKEWSDTLIANLGGGILNPPSPAVIEEELRVVEAMRTYFSGLADERRRGPRRPGRNRGDGDQSGQREGESERPAAHRSAGPDAFGPSSIRPARW